MAAKPTDVKPSLPQPVSLSGHVVPEERLGLIGPHMAALAQMALKVSDMLPLGADAGDFAATLHRDATHRDGV
jgi:hypothetical protein